MQVLYFYMMKGFLILFLLITQFAFGQIKSASYNTLLSTIYNNTVPLISCDELDSLPNKVVLDTREKDEYEVSHIKSAVWVGFDDFTKKRVASIEKEAIIVVYCSIGKRSEEIGEKLKRMGFKNVSNLHGGIFEWVNQGHPVFKGPGIETDDIHPYSAIWGIWLTRGNKVYK